MLRPWSKHGFDLPIDSTSLLFQAAGSTPSECSHLQVSVTIHTCRASEHRGRWACSPGLGTGLICGVSRG